MSTPHLRPLLALLLCLGACPGPADPSDSDASGTSDTSATQGVGETTVATPTTSDAVPDATSDDATTATSDATTDATTTNADPTGSGADDGCAAYCARLSECGDPQAEGCSEWCPSAGRGYGYIGDACIALYAAANACVVGLTCDQLLNDPGACDDAWDLIIGETCTIAPCRDLCDKLVACGEGAGEGIPCSSECSLAAAASFSEAGAVCTDAIEAMLACEAALECDQLDPLQGCELESDAVDRACG